MIAKAKVGTAEALSVLRMIAKARAGNAEALRW
jgi:hypothetical protein